MDEVVICELLELTWEQLQRQPGWWVDERLKLKGFIAEHEEAIAKKNAG
jgi:hypothetical protein